MLPMVLASNRWSRLSAMVANLVEPLVEDTQVVIQEEQLGTAHAVKIARRGARSDARSARGAHLGDSPLIRPETITALVEAQQASQAAVVVLSMEMEDPSGYGRIVRDAQGGVCAIVEHKDCTPEQVTIGECNSGFYCFDKEFLLTALDEVSTQNVQGEYYLTDVLALAYQAGRVIGCLRAEDPLECMGVNSRSQLAEASACLQARINTAHMENGVTIIDPATTWIGPDVKIAQDTEIWPMSFLFGSTCVGSDCVVGPHSRLVDTVVGNGCTLEETIALESRIDDDAYVAVRVPICAPNAYVRWFEGGHARRDQEVHDREGIEGSSSFLYRGCDAWRRCQHRSRHDHVQLRRREEVAHHRGRSRVRGKRCHARCAGLSGERFPYRCRLGHHERCLGGSARAWSRAPDRDRGLERKEEEKPIIPPLGKFA